MRCYDPLKPLIFIHVPKCAGTAVRQVVESWFPKNFHQHYYNGVEGRMPVQIPSQILNDPASPPVIYGHFNKNRKFGIQDYYPSVSQFVTILRDPFETVISRYFFMRKVGKNLKDQSRVPTEDLESYLKHVTPNILNHFPDEMNLTNYKDLLEERFIEIGVTEMLPLSLHRIAQKLNKQFKPASLEFVNDTKRDQPTPEAFRDMFAEKYLLEYSVYEYAKSRISGLQ